MTKKMDGHVAVVTGGSRGLGEMMVRAFAAEGANVVIASRKLEPCAVLAESVREEYGVETLAIDVNVSKWDQCDKLVEAVYARFDKVDVLVNNAGMSPLYDDLTSVTEELFDKVVDVNLKGPFRLAVLFGERMRRDGGGKIVNVGSIEAMSRSRRRCRTRWRSPGCTRSPRAWPGRSLRRYGSTPCSPARSSPISHEPGAPSSRQASIGVRVSADAPIPRRS